MPDSVPEISVSPDLPFEEALDELEALVEEMESDRMPLEKLIVGYEQGMQLHKVCQKRLSEAQGRIEIIRKRAHGEVEVEPFDEGKGESTSASTATETPASSEEPNSDTEDGELF